mmetsp:Transcript_27689/g.66709  ORF Transcript_27689/g.66709 Transcript_27689/m.66709 type:complete len:202 (-) Transcript_27689:2746-3351(-)
MYTPAVSYNFCRASAVLKRLAPSTINFDDGSPSGPIKCLKLFPSIVLGRPPQGKNASAFNRLCILFRALTPSSVSTVCKIPSVFSFAWSKFEIQSPSWNRRSNSSWSNPSGSSAQPEWSATPTIFALSPYSRIKILISFPPTSPSGPPVIFTVKGCVVGSIPRVARKATSRYTFTPSEVTPYSLWLIPARGLELMNAAGVL